MSWYLMSLVPLMLGAFCFENDFLEGFKKRQKQFKNLSLFQDDGKRRMLNEAMSRSLMVARSKNSKNIPQYKFYTELFEELLSLRRRLGLSLEPSLKSLREGLVQDTKFEKKVRAELIGSYSQFLLLSLITWSFCFLSMQLIDYKLEGKIAFAMLLLQVLGLILFSFLFYRLKKRLFSPYAAWFLRLYKLQGLLSSGTPLSEALKESQVMELFQRKEKKFIPFQEAMDQAIRRLKEEGTPILPDIKFCLDELWFTQDLDFELFLKGLSSLKLSVILLFYLGSYFLYLYSFISTFMKP